MEGYDIILFYFYVFCEIFMSCFWSQVVCDFIFYVLGEQFKFVNLIKFNINENFFLFLFKVIVVIQVELDGDVVWLWFYLDLNVDLLKVVVVWLYGVIL